LLSIWGYGSPEKGRGSYRFDAQGCATIHLNFASAGKYRLQVRSKSNGFENTWPVVTCHLDHRLVQQFTTDSPSFSPHAFSLEVAESGVHSLSFTYRNAATGGARNLIIEGFTIEWEGAGAPPESGQRP
jgi:hypothetical protein